MTTVMAQTSQLTSSCDTRIDLEELQEPPEPQDESVLVRETILWVMLC